MIWFLFACGGNHSTPSIPSKNEDFPRYLTAQSCPSQSVLQGQEGKEQYCLDPDTNKRMGPTLLHTSHGLLLFEYHQDELFALPKAITETGQPSEKVLFHYLKDKKDKKQIEQFIETYPESEYHFSLQSTLYQEGHLGLPELLEAPPKGPEARCSIPS